MVQGPAGMDPVVIVMFFDSFSSPKENVFFHPCTCIKTPFLKTKKNKNKKNPEEHCPFRICYRFFFKL